MPTFSIISPLDQPLGKRRLLVDLKSCLVDEKFTEFGLAVAFAKVGPLYRLQASLNAWRAAGKRSVAIFGIDHKGTSVQALAFALAHFDEVYYTQYPGHSFHPKIYWFRGPTDGLALVGSNNLTVGGTEINFEAMIQLGFTLPKESGEFQQAYNAFAELLPASCPATHPLTPQALNTLDAAGYLLDESKKQPSGTASGGKWKAAAPAAGGAKLPVKPQSALPRSIFQKKPPTKDELAAKAKILQAQAASVDVTKPLVPVQGLAIQIKPHNNGEIFLSRIAAQQNPAFFGMPFTGKTTPKKPNNPTYPQRTPDPVCNIVVYGAQNAVITALRKYALNTVFYEAKSEIRVTASPLVGQVPDYSVMVMTLSDEPDVDYELQIYRPDSPDYAHWVSICDQTMPSGGKTPRKFGWF